MQMDCPTEEALIRKKLGDMTQVKSLEFNLMQRVLTVVHTPQSLEPILAALRSLGFEPELADGSGKLAGVDWVFNCWGNLFPDYAEDAALAKRILAHTDTPRLAAPFVLEGGSFHVDGEGTVLTTAQCLLHPNRNPHLIPGLGHRDLLIRPYFIGQMALALNLYLQVA